MEDGDEVERQVRAARNQTLFRTVNERLEGLAETFELPSETPTFACECVDIHCVEQVSLTVGEYEEVRKHPTHFAVLPGHVYPEVERVVAENERFVVVEKIGKGAEIAAEADERSAS